MPSFKNLITSTGLSNTYKFFQVLTTLCISPGTFSPENRRFQQRSYNLREGHSQKAIGSKSFNFLIIFLSQCLLNLENTPSKLGDSVVGDSGRIWWTRPPRYSQHETMIPAEAFMIRFELEFFHICRLRSTKPF